MPAKPLAKPQARFARSTYARLLCGAVLDHVADEGVGLAANQVDLPYRLFVANPEGKREAQDTEYVFINPVLSGGRGQVEDEEGCLSIPGLYAPVTRNETRPAPPAAASVRVPVRVRNAPRR